MKNITIGLFCIILSISSHINGQEFTPIVTQFTGKDYNASNQNWSVAQDETGIMYFGNNQGLLQFDGSSWETYKMPENKLVRSVLINDSNHIYVGSFEEFGYFQKNELGGLKYFSLSSQLKTYKMKNDEIWNIINFNGTIIFQSFTSYFTYKDGIVKGYRCPFTFLFFKNFKNNIYTHTEQLGFSLLQSKTANFSSIHNNNILKSPVISIITLNNKVALLATKQNGLFTFDGNSIKAFETEADNEFRKNEINRAVLTKDGLIIIGTIQNGVTAIDQKGKKRWTLNTSNVLQNNTVLGMYCDRENNIWLALDKGISLIHTNSSVQYIHAFDSSIGSIYALSYNDSKLYIGTNQGLYTADFNVLKHSINNFKASSQIKGQVWDIQQFDKQIICGNNESTYDISQQGVRQMAAIKGGMCIKKGKIHGKDVLVQGTYSELCIYEKINGNWVFRNTVENFIDPIRYLEIDYTGTIWVSHLHQGMYSIQLSTDLKKIEQKNTFKSLDQKNEFPIAIFSINNRVVFTDNTAFYTFDDIKKKIIPYAELNKGLGYFSHCYRVCAFNSSLYWFINNNEAALFEIKANEVKLLDIVEYALFLNQTVDNYQNIIPISENECLFTLENGLAIYSKKKTKRTAIRTNIELKSILTNDVELKNSAYLPIANTTVPEIPFKRNSLVFNVYYPEYSSLNNINFRYKLKGLDIVWSKVSQNPTKEYKYIPYGEYEFMVEAVTNSGERLSSLSYSFVIKPPYYLSKLAKTLYIILALMLIYGIYYLIHLKYQKKNEKIRQDQEAIRIKEIEKKEQHIIELQNEKLESELILKSKELAASTMIIIKKKEVLVTLKEEITAQKLALGKQYPTKYYDRIIHLLDTNLTSEDDWSIFQANFDRIHENFFRNLHLNYPDLTSNDLRFCAYLRLNLSSKDIAHLLNISLKGVEVGRYRIRKKIGIPSTKSLTEFMIEFK